MSPVKESPPPRPVADIPSELPPSFSPFSFFTYWCLVHQLSQIRQMRPVGPARNWIVHIWLSDIVKDYIKQAKAHMGQTCQNMESDLSLTSHHVDVQVCQRHVANRCSRNAPKTLDKELLAMGDTDRRQSLVERTQVASPHLLHCLPGSLWLYDLWPHMLLAIR